MSDPKEDLAALQADLVGQWVAFREDPQAKAGTRMKLLGKLDGLYWKRVEAILRQRVAEAGERLDFTDGERLVVDMGFLDAGLVGEAREDLPQRLLAELAMPGPVNHFYLTEWLEDRYQRFQTTAEFGTEEAEEEEKPKTRGDPLLYAARTQILGKLRAFFDGLPGVSPEVARTVVQGELDERILELDLALLQNHTRKGFLYRRRLHDLRGYVFSRARGRTNDQATLKGFDQLDEIFRRDWQKRYVDWEKRDPEDSATMLAATVDADEQRRQRALEHLLSELRFVRTLMPLGALAGGVLRSCAVLLEDGSRVTRVDTEKGLARARACDWGVDIDPVVVIAPFQGRGIYEWDRDSLVISLVPVQDAEDSVANAVGNYRMLVDSLQWGGSLKKDFEERFPEAKFQKAFQEDYRTWICKVGHGEAEAMPEERRAFFRERMAPDCSGVPASASLRNLGPLARRAVRRRLDKEIAQAGADPQLHHRLAILHWLDGQLDPALGHLAKAAKAAPEDGEVLFAFGLLLRALGEPERAARVFEVCRRRQENSIWGVYADDALTGAL